MVNFYMFIFTKYSLTDMRILLSDFFKIEDLKL